MVERWGQRGHGAREIEDDDIREELQGVPDECSARR